MIKTRERVALRDFTTFKIGGPASMLIEVEHAGDLPEAFEHAQRAGFPALVLGGGSNMLVSDSGFGGAVIHIHNRGIELENEPNTDARILRVNAGEVWDDVVQYAVEHELWGIENLSRIPGFAGAFAVQNVGAYGTEAKDVVLNVLVYDPITNKLDRLTNQECNFSYRKSVFNTSAKGRYVILQTLLRLSTTPSPNLGYPDLKSRFGEGSAATPRLDAIRQAIREIRDAKFPFPAESVEGNAGSFFKNALLDEAGYEALKRMFGMNLPEHLEKLEAIRHRFPLADAIKIPTAFILEACGLKEMTNGNARLNPTQPVVVLNATGTASAAEVLGLVQRVRSTVEGLTGLHLYTEPELIGFTEAELRDYGFIDSEIDRYVHNINQG